MVLRFILLGITCNYLVFHLQVRRSSVSSTKAKGKGTKPTRKTKTDNNTKAK